MGQKHLKKLRYNKKIIFLFLFLVIGFSLSVPIKNISHAQEIDDQSLSEIRLLLNIKDTDISDGRLREVLNQETPQGITEGEWICGLIKQMQLGLQLKSGYYYTRYSSYFNEIVDSRTADNFWGALYKYVKQAIVSDAIDFASAHYGSVAGDVVGLMDKIKTVFEINDVFQAVIVTEIDSFLRVYIDFRQSGDDDVTAWNLVKDWIPLNLDMDNVHAYFLNAWDAYHLADNYVELVAGLRGHIYDLALPKAVISANPTSGIVPLNVDFDASSSTGTEGQSIQGYLWDYGDGYSGWGVTTTHEYETPGTYTVTLTVTDSAQLENSTTQKINAKSPVHVRFIPPDNAPPPLDYHYDASASTDDKGNDHISSDSSYVWNFNDEATAIGKEENYTFLTEGFKLITLTVTDDLGYYDIHQEGLHVGHGGPTYVNGGTITGNIKWTTYGSPYIVLGNITVAQGGTLTIEPGVRVELAPVLFTPWWYPQGFTVGAQIEVKGTLIAKGVTFTWADEGHPWAGIWFEGQGSSNSRLEDCMFEHAAGVAIVCLVNELHYNYLGVITVRDSSPTITGCTIDNSNAGTGVWLRSSLAEVSNNIINGIIDSGIVVGGYVPSNDWYCGGVNNPSSPTVTGNTITNSGTGIYVTDMGGGVFQSNTFSGNISYGLYFSGTNTIDATNCNWGDSSGPLDDSDDRATGGLFNPNGLGNRVSDHVNYYPWVGATAPAVPTGLAGMPEDSAINLTWNAVADPSLDGYKIYYRNSSGSYAPIKVGNVTSHKLTQLTNGTPYYIAISSVNFVGAESAKCAEIMVTPNADTDKPASAIIQPLNGSNIYTNIFIIKGIANDGAGSGVQKVEVSTDGGLTWNLATNTTSWSYAWMIPGTGTYNIKSRATDNANNEETPGAGIMVTVVNRQQTPVTVNGRKLMVNGSPFTIKGVGYSPVPVGDDPETTSPYGDYFTSDYSSIYDRDFPLLRDMGANVIRLWGWNNTADHLDFLDKVYNGGVEPIYVIAGFWINPDLDIDPDSPDNVREQIKADFREMIEVHKNHPAILMWAIGNDLNEDNMYGGNLDHLFSLINEMAEEAHTEEVMNYHPVTTSLSDNNLISTISTLDSSVPSLDVWGVNVYRGNTFGTLFNDYEAVSQKPLVILEYGIDAFDNDHGNEYEKTGTPYQADYAEALWKEVEVNSDTCIGGSIMAYSDEWYKGEYSTDPGCPDNDPAYHCTCGYATSSHPDGYCNEEWWGIMRTKNNGDNPDVIEPRAVYYRMQSLWVQAPVFAVSGKVIRENGTGILGVTMNFRKISGKGSIPSSVQTDTDGNWSQSGFEPGTKYRVTPSKTNFIFTPSFRNFSDIRTDLNFTGAKAITVVSPDGEEVWKRRTYHVIQWKFNGNPGPYVRIELLKNGVVNSIIHKSYPIDVWNSRYPWVIPVNQSPGKNYRIRVTSTFNNSYSDTSNKTFTITK